MYYIKNTFIINIYVTFFINVNINLYICIYRLCSVIYENTVLIDLLISSQRWFQHKRLTNRRENNIYAWRSLISSQAREVWRKLCQV